MTPSRFATRLWVGCLLALAACNRPSGETASASGPAAPAVRAKAVKPARRDLVRRILLPAGVRADLEVTLYNKVTGYVKSISKDRGDKVKAGELIALLEVPEMALELESARASFALEDTTFKRLEAIRKVERTAVTDQDIDLSRAKRAMAEATLKRLETLLSYTEIRAPFDGYVTERFVDPGALIQQGKIVSIVDTSKVRILLDVPEPEVRFAEVGTAAQVKLDALPGPGFPATIVRRASALDAATRSMRVELEIPNPERKILPGMFARVQLDVERHPQVLAVPSRAVVAKQDKAYVFVHAEGAAKKIAVTTGLEDGGWIEAVDGLTGEESVLVPEGQELSDGLRVDLGEEKR